jgi:hypothetical protein
LRWLHDVIDVESLFISSDGATLCAHLKIKHDHVVKLALKVSLGAARPEYMPGKASLAESSSIEKIWEHETLNGRKCLMSKTCPFCQG